MSDGPVNVKVIPVKASAEDACAEAIGLLRGQPVFLAGSAVSAGVHGKAEYGDVDLFTPTQQVLIATVQLMLDNGYTLDDRFDRVWHRWLRYGMRGWSTNSIRLHSKKDVPVNVVYKLIDKHPTTSLAQVLESFDFGLLGVGWDLEHGQFRDMRGYLFPGLDPDGPLPMMPARREAWRNGFFSRYNGIRQASRYAKYHGYGYDMSAIKDDLITGYEQSALYHLNHFDEEKQLLGQIYQRLAERVGDDEIDELLQAYKVLDFSDELDAIMDALF